MTSCDVHWSEMPDDSASMTCKHSGESDEGGCEWELATHEPTVLGPVTGNDWCTPVTALPAAPKRAWVPTPCEDDALQDQVEHRISRTHLIELKTRHGDDLRRFAVPLDGSHAQLERRLRRCYGLHSTGVKV